MCNAYPEWKTQLDAILPLVGIPEEDGKVLYETLSRIVGNEEASALFLTHYDRYYREDTMDFFALLEDFGKMAGLIGLPAETVFLCGFLVLLPHAEKFYTEKGIEREDRLAVLRDFYAKNEECKKRHGVVGCHCSFWMGYWFNASRLAFGRLQFEPTKLKGDVKTAHVSAKEGDLVFAVHIPSYPTTLSPESVQLSFDRASAYFSRVYGVEKPLFHCCSWLLAPFHSDLLPASSNVRRFAETFDVYAFHPETDDLWRIFYSEGKDYRDFPETTSMQRLYKKFLLDGGEVGMGEGVRYARPFDD